MFDLISRLVPRVIVRGHAVKDIFLLVPVQWSVVGRQRGKAILWRKKFRPFLTDSLRAYIHDDLRLEKWKSFLDDNLIYGPDKNFVSLRVISY